MGTTDPGPGDRVVLIDGTALATRAFFAVPARMVTRGGLHTNALFGLSQACRRILAGKAPSHAVALFDPPGVTRGLPGADPVHYPPELRQQRPWFQAVIRAHGFETAHPDLPVADAIAGLTDLAVRAGAQVRVVSPDKWLLQLVSEAVRVDDPLKELVWNSDAVLRRYGVIPALLPDFWALVGDEPLNVPGIRGIGPKRAKQLLDERGDAGAAGDEAAAWADALRLGGDMEPDWERWRFEPPDPEALNDLYLELELFQLLAAQAPAARPEYFVCDTPEVAAAALGEVRGTATPIGVHVLFEGQPHQGRITGIGLAMRPGRAVYYPFAGPGAVLGAAELAAVGEWLSDPSHPKVFHDAKAARGALWARGIELAGVVGDTQLGSFRIDPSDRLPHDLDQVARALLHRAVQAERAMVGQGDERRAFRDLPIGRAGAYACHLADAVVALWPVIERRLKTQGQLAALRSTDLPLSRALTAIESRGVPVDRQALAALEAGFATLRAQVQAQIDAAAGRAVKTGSVKDVGRLLFEELDLPVLRRTKTGYKTDADVLERLADRHPVVPLILRWRTLSQLERTWAKGLPKHIDPQTGRIHSTFQMTASGHGHLVNQEPDLQRVPGRTAEGALIRGCFRADPGWTLVSADWSQLELRLFAHMGGDPVLLDAFRTGQDVHARTAAAIGEDRETGKMVNFATLYGQGPSSLGIVLRRPKSEAAAIIERFDETYAATREWQRALLALAEERGVAHTMTGRRRVIHELSSRESSMRAYGERLARNFPVQGSAADLTRSAITRVAQAIEARGLGGGVLLAIHDELLLECPESQLTETIELVRHEMETVFDLEVPLVVRIGVGATWAEAAADR